MRLLLILCALLLTSPAFAQYRGALVDFHYTRNGVQSVPGNGAYTFLRFYRDNSQSYDTDNLFPLPSGQTYSDRFVIPSTWAGKKIQITCFVIFEGTYNQFTLRQAVLWSRPAGGTFSFPPIGMGVGQARSNGATSDDVTAVSAVTAATAGDEHACTVSHGHTIDGAPANLNVLTAWFEIWEVK
jgi:hypothetical protein